MLIRASDIIGKPIYTHDDGAIGGAVKEIIVSPENGRVLGFINKTFFQPQNVVSEQDVIAVNQRGVAINDLDALIPPQDVIKISAVLKKKIHILNSLAQTENGKKLGCVEDFVIETETASIIKFYIKGGMLSPFLILSSDDVVKIDAGKIIFTDSVLERPTKAASEPAI